MTTGNTLKHTGMARTLHTCRAYFQFSENFVNNSRQFVFDFGNDVETGITATTYSDKTDAWYTLDGRKLNGKPTSKGIYVHNGRKVVIRSTMQTDDFQIKK